MQPNDPSPPDGPTGEPERVVVLGVGNLLWADEGFGVRCVELLGQGWEFPPQVELMDGGTMGLALIPMLLDASHILVFDAVEFRGEPGTLMVARDEDVPRFMSQGAMSLHQVTMNDVLASLEMLGHRPAAFTVVGVKPVQLADYGGSLTPQVRAQIPEALRRGLEELARWGVPGRERSDAGRSVVPEAIGLTPYEAGRPSEEAALRIGDERFLALRAAGASNKDDQDA
ncbi:MAG TPA: HyaD/HybD family hydrogenase maturation endopeptidase [Steroidobacteraceae bacterium]|nr:HyaD/HybD family hydrogenase maturation endopeptidase [Steroidobacteraceae bacterium]